MLDIVTPKSYRKDYKKAIKQERDLSILDDIVLRLAQGEQLDQKYRDHALTGNYRGSRECHLEPDWLLIYEVMDSQLILYRTGSHSELLGK